VRLATVHFLPKLAKVVGREMFQAKLESVLINMLMDNVFTIREAAVESLVKISKSIMNSEWLEQIFIQKVKEFSKHDRFMIRIHSIHFIKGLGAETPDPQSNPPKMLPAAVSKDVVNRHFAEVLLHLAEDPVPNIRFNVSKAMWLLY